VRLCKVFFEKLIWISSFIDQFEKYMLCLNVLKQSISYYLRSKYLTNFTKKGISTKCRDMSWKIRDMSWKIRDMSWKISLKKASLQNVEIWVEKYERKVSVLLTSENRLLIGKLIDAEIWQRKQ
jgi:hypothetical protein